MRDIGYVSSPPMVFSLPALPNPGVLSSSSSHASGYRRYSPPFKSHSKFVIQSLRDEDAAGKSASDIVDNNMAILRGRIHQVQLKDCYAAKFPFEGTYDWTHRVRRRQSTSSNGVVSSVMEMVVVASSAVGFVFLSGSFCILLVSLVVAWMDNYYCS